MPSAPSVHSTFTKYSVLFNPVLLSCFNDKGIRASHLLKREEVEVSKVVPGKVEVLTHPCVPVVSHRPPVLCAPLPAGASVSNFADILLLAWLSKALPCLV